jgi:hypothetical protein
MVAMTIMGMVVTVAFAGLSIGIDGWNRGSQRLDRLEERMTLERLMKRQLAVSHPFRIRENNQDAILFRGTSQELEFVSDYSLAYGKSDFRKVGYAFRDGHLMYAETDLFSYVPGQQTALEAHSVGTFQSVRFRFFSRTQEGEPVWRDDWSPVMGMPVAVQVEIEGDVLIVALVNRR